MKKVSSVVFRFLQAEDGPTAIEYAILLALIVVVCVGMITKLGAKSNDSYTTVANTVSSSSP
jgi:pilus assembly protein Flp/PilA